MAQQIFTNKHSCIATIQNKQQDITNTPETSFTFPPIT